MRILASLVMIAVLPYFAGAVLAESLNLTSKCLQEKEEVKCFREEVRSAARISGTLVTGVQRQGLSSGGVRLRAYVPSEWAGETICSRVVSIDGLYEAANDYEVAPSPRSGGYADLPYPTNFPDKLNEMAHDGLGVRVSRGGCEGPPGDATLALWNGAQTEPLSLLINSFQADSVFVYVGSSTVPVRCAPVALNGRSAYDVTCPLDGIGETGQIRLQLLRIVNAKAMPPTSIILWLP